MKGRNIYLFFLILFTFNLSSEHLVIDVRTLDEWNQGHLSSAIRIEWQEITLRINELTLDKDQEIMLYCQSGNRSGKALKLLNKIGFLNVINAGGLLEAQELIGDKIVINNN